MYFPTKLHSAAAECSLEGVMSKKREPFTEQFSYSQQYDEEAKRYDDKVRELEHALRVARADAAQTTKVMRLQYEQVVRQQDSIIKLEEENRLLRQRVQQLEQEQRMQGMPRKSATELEETLEKLELREESLEREIMELADELDTVEKTRNSLARQTGQAYYQARPRIAQLDNRKETIVNEMDQKQTQLRSVKGLTTKAKNQLQKWKLL
jgi:homeobox protein cut-like